MKDSQGLTPLHMAAPNPAPGVAACIIPLMLDHGADVHAEHERTRLSRVQPLHCAAANEYTHAGAGAALQLLAAGADVSAASYGGCRPLYFAARTGSLNAVQALLAADGIDVNARDCKGRTALHRAASSRGDPLTGEQLVGALVAAGADLDTADQRGCKPVDLARQAELYVSAVHALLHHADGPGVAAEAQLQGSTCSTATARGLQQHARAPASCSIACRTQRTWCNLSTQDRRWAAAGLRGCPPRQAQREPLSDSGLSPVAGSAAEQQGDRDHAEQ